MIVYLMQRREELMINTAPKNLNNIINIIGNNMEKVLLSRSLEHFSSRTEALMIFSGETLGMDLEGFSLYRQVLVCSLTLLGRGGIVNKIITEGRRNTMRNIVREELIGCRYHATSFSFIYFLEEQ